MEKPRILIIGAGVNGCVTASELFKGGVDVTLLARGTRVEQLQSHGIIIENPFTHRRTNTHLPVTDHLLPDDFYDYVLVVVRKNQAVELLPLLSQNASPCFVFMGNNILGPDEFIKVLGRERVMMGFVFAGGKRDGDLIRAIMVKFARSPFGELDGLLTPRLSRLASILEQGGFKVECSTNIIDTQMTHSVGIAILAALVLKNGGRIRNLAKSSDDMHLFILARREGQKLIQHLGHQVLPESDISRAGLPVSLQVATFRLLLNSKIGEVGLQYHIDQAPDEMQRLILELRQLLSMVNIPLPAIRKALAEKA